MKKILSIAGKELKLYFGSPMVEYNVSRVGFWCWRTCLSFSGSIHSREAAPRVVDGGGWVGMRGPAADDHLLGQALTMHQWASREPRESGNSGAADDAGLRPEELVAGKFLSALTLVALALV